MITWETYRDRLKGKFSEEVLKARWEEFPPVEDDAWDDRNLFVCSPEPYKPITLSAAEYEAFRTRLQEEERKPPTPMLVQLFLEGRKFQQQFTKQEGTQGK